MCSVRSPPIFFEDQNIHLAICVENNKKKMLFHSEMLCTFVSEMLSFSMLAGAHQMSNTETWQMGVAGFEKREKRWFFLHTLV